MVAVFFGITKLQKQGEFWISINN